MDKEEIFLLMRGIFQLRNLLITVLFQIDQKKQYEQEYSK